MSHVRVLLRVGAIASVLAMSSGVAAAQRHRRLPSLRVLPGIDVLLDDSAHLVAGRRVGLITNQAGVDAAGIPSIDRLARHAGTRLVALFAPEHGIRGTATPGERVWDSVDAGTGIPIYSLYGASRAPSAGQLGGLDVLLVDLQDVGARPFTYVSTMVHAMRAAAAAGKRMIVLDRPNPIGCGVSGPVLDTAYASFVGLLPVPLRHGMTIGELARFANAELRIGADLVVVPVNGWHRCMWYDETGLPWVRPSPNLPDLESVAWYPGTVLFEASGLSVGRGTDHPFRQVGAPWLETARIADAVWRHFGLRVDTVSFTPHEPGDGKFDGVAVRGLRLRRAERGPAGDPVRDALRLLEVISAFHAVRIQVDSLGLARRLGVWPVGATYEWPEDVAASRRARGPYLLYR